MVLVKELELLFDGRIRVIFFGGASTYLIPLIVATSFPNITLIRLSGQPATFVNIDTTIETIDGVPFVGTFDDLEILLRQMAIDANIIFSDSVLNGGGGGSGGATEANQVLEIEATESIIEKLMPLNFDAFARLRISQPQTVFDSKQISDNQPLFFDDQQTSGAGTSSTYNTNQASTTLAVSNLTAGTRVRQTFRRFNYQPGKSFLFIRTAIVGVLSSGNTKRLGLYDNQNGFFFEFTTVAKVVIRSYTSGAAIDTAIVQSSWNLDKLDGTGTSGITLDFTKTLIYFCDFEWLGVGSVRFGFFIDGMPIYCHQFNNSNINTVVYMSTPNLPLRTEISNSGAGGVASITDICSTVIVEGGRQRTGVSFGLNRDDNTLVTLNSLAIFPTIGIRLKTTHLGALIDLVSTYVSCSSSATYSWYLILSPTVVGVVPTWLNLTNSSIQYCYPTNTTTLTGGTIIATGVGTDTAQIQLGVSSMISNELLLGSNIAGTPQELFLAVKRLTGTTETFYSCLTLNDTH